MKLKPLKDYVVTKRLEVQSKTPGGLFVPETAKEKGNKATVVAVGPGVYLPNGELKPLTVKVGDTVVLHSTRGSELDLDGEKFLVVQEYDISMVLENE